MTGIQKIALYFILLPLVSSRVLRPLVHSNVTNIVTPVTILHICILHWSCGLSNLSPSLFADFPACFLVCLVLAGWSSLLLRIILHGNRAGMSDPRSPLSPIDVGGEPGSYPIPVSPSLSASADRDLLEARARASNMVALAPGQNRIILQNAESGTRIKSLPLRSATLNSYELWLFEIKELLSINGLSHLIESDFAEPTIEQVASLHTELGTADLPAKLREYQLAFQAQ